MVTIFTPTYNRLSKIKKLASSLEMQTKKDFEWLVVDDGSRDGTEEWLLEYKRVAPIKINYIKQNNQGKHIAYNTAIEQSNGDYFMCVDSDDYMPNDAVEIITNTIYSNLKEKDIIGFIFPSVTGDLKTKRIWRDIDSKKVDIIDLKEQYGVIETSIVFRCDVLRKYRFPIFTDKNGKQEKFCPEGLFYNKFISDGKFLAVNKIIYIYEYQENGLTRNIFSLWKNNFYGTIAELRSRYEVDKKYGIWKRTMLHFKCVMNINALCIVKKEHIFEHTPSFGWSIILYVPSVVFSFVRFGKRNV